MMPSQSQASVQRILTGGTARRVVLIAVTSAVMAATPLSASPARKSSLSKARVAHHAKNRAARRHAKPASQVAKVVVTPRAGSRFMAVSADAPAGTGIPDPNAPSLLQVPVQATPAGELPTAPAPAATDPAAPVAPTPVAPDTPTATAPTVTPPGEAPVAVVAPDVTIPTVTPPAVTPAPAIEPAPLNPAPNDVPNATDTTPPATIAEQATALRGLGEIRRRQLRYSEATDFFKRATLLAPADFPARIGLAQSLRGLRHFQEALVESEQALALEPNSLQARVLHAQLLDDNNRSDEAAKEIEAIVAALPAKPEPETYTALSQAFINQRNYAAALQLLERGKQDWPGDPFIGRNYAEALTASRDWDKALAAWDALMVADPKDSEALVGKARVYYYQGNYKAASDLLERGRQEWPQDTLIARNYAEVLTQLREWDKALAAWDAVPADPKDAGVLLGKARIYNYSSREELAEPLYRQVLGIEPGNYQAQVELADIVARHGNWPEAIRLYQTALATNQKDLPTRVELARVLRYSGRYAEAETELNGVLAADPAFSPAYTERGILRGQNKQIPLAMADLRRALELTPDDLTAQFGLAEVLGYDKQYDESIRLYRQALEKDPENQKGRVELGLELSYAGRGEDALKVIDSVLADNPQNMSARVAKADTLARMGRYTESIALYNTIPDDRRAKTGLAEAYVYSKQYSKAIAIYDELIKANPNDVALAIDRGRALGYAGMHREAVRTLRAIVEAHPDNQPARFAFAEAETNSGEVALRADAIKQYTQLKADANTSNSLDARFGLGRVLGYQGRTREAEAELRAVIAARPGDASAYYALAEVQRYTKPFEAKDNYQRAVKLSQPGFAQQQALTALRGLQRETGPSLDLSARRYTDTNNVRLTEYGGGPTFRTRAGTIGIYARDGRYEDEGFWQTRRSYSLLLAHNFGSVHARLLLSRVQYAIAPDRTLYDLMIEKSSGFRKRYYMNLARREIIESGGATNAGITARVLTAGIEWPLAPHFDASLEGRTYNYSDGNHRTTLSPALYYRLRPTYPSLRIGLGYTRDDTRFLAPPATFYYTPQQYKTFALLADYVKTQGRTRYGVFAAHPLSSSTGIGGTNRPSDTLFGFVQHDLTDLIQLFVEGGIVRGPSFDSNDITGGISIGF